MKLLHLIAAVRDAIKPINERRQELQAKKRQLERELERVMTGAACKSDVKTALSIWVRETRTAYVGELRTTLAPHVRDPSGLATPSKLVTPINIVAAAHPYEGGLDAADISRLVCGLFPDLVETALARTIDAMEWPDEGLPLKDRAPLAERLRQQLAALESEETELISQAEALGLRDVIA